MIRSKINSRESDLLDLTAIQLQVDPDDLYRLIDFESGWNPLAKNPNSTARGLIQFVDSTSRKLGYSDSSELVQLNPTITDQLPIVKNYLMGFKPFYGKQSLYMSVFYPAARSWQTGKKFPESVRIANPGIDTVGDYMNKVDKKNNNFPASTVVLVAAIFFF